MYGNPSPSAVVETVAERSFSTSTDYVRAMEVESHIVLFPLGILETDGIAFLSLYIHFCPPSKIDTHIYPKRTIGTFFDARSEEHTSELQSLMRTSYADFCLKNKTKT